MGTGLALAGRVAIVTGSSRGIGKRIALAIASEGAKVVVCGRTQETRPEIEGTILDTMNEIRSAGGEAIAVKCDVSDEAEVAHMIDETMETWHRIDILVNNAGVSRWARVIDTPVKDWDRVVAVNLRGTFLCSKMALPHMIKAKRGSVINITSWAAGTERKSRAGLSYGATKAGIERFSQGFAEEVAEYNIAVNALKPAKPVDTEGMRRNAPASERATWVSAEKMCKASVFLSQQDAHGVTGGVWWDEELCDKYRL
ncbi:MAG: SDR family NAD(P)-dependent oxidoreductase [Dehalococcoidia bacterium]|nr:SDR family NAD(P)-dependent oxidoreductase [Dehalococcoidia bacterium]